MDLKDYVKKLIKNEDQSVIFDIYLYEEKERKIKLDDWIHNQIKSTLYNHGVIDVVEEKKHEKYLYEVLDILSRRIIYNFEVRSEDYDEFLKEFLSYMKISIKGIVNDKLKEKYYKKNRVISIYKNDNFEYYENKYLGSYKYNPEKLFLKNKNKKDLIYRMESIINNKITEKQKSALENYFLNDNNVEQLAEKMGCSNRNIYYLKDRALNNIRKEITEELDEKLDCLVA